MKIALAALLLSAMASLPYAAARVGQEIKAGQKTKAGQKNLKLKSQQQLGHHKVHLATKQTLKDASEENRIINRENADQGEFPFYLTDPPPDDEFPCKRVMDGLLVCYQQGYPADGFTLDYFCPASASNMTDCIGCAIVALDSATQCRSCTICSDTGAVVYDCSNVAEGDCVTKDCDGNCESSDRQIGYTVLNVAVFTLLLILIVEFIGHRLDVSATGRPFFKSVLDRVYKECKLPVMTSHNLMKCEKHRSRTLC